MQLEKKLLLHRKQEVVKRPRQILKEFMYISREELARTHNRRTFLLWKTLFRGQVQRQNFFDLHRISSNQV